jgi:hypothetical protein
MSKIGRNSTSGITFDIINEFCNPIAYRWSYFHYMMPLGVSFSQLKRFLAFWGINPHGNNPLAVYTVMGVKKKSTVN